MIDTKLLERILRAPGEVATRCREGQVDDIAVTALAVLAVSAMAFGGTVGSWRGEWQIAFGALKMPLALLGSLALAAPAFFALAAVLGRPWRLRAIFSLVLAAGARFALVLLATTPPLWLVIDFGTPYPLVKLIATFGYGLAGLAGLEVLVRGLGEGPGRKTTLVLFSSVFLLIGAQNAWVLRPWLGTPGERAITLFTAKREGGLVVQLHRALLSLRGNRDAE